MAKIRLDQLLVQRKVAESREQAQRLIRAGMVRVLAARRATISASPGPDVEALVSRPESHFNRGRGQKIHRAATKQPTMRK